ADSRAMHCLDPGRRRANRTEIAIEARRCRLQRLEALRQHGGIGRAVPPAESKPEAVKLHVDDFEREAERSEQKLQQNAGRLVEIVLDASQALRELPADVVEGGRIAAPQGGDAFLPADEMEFDDIAGAVSDPGRRA